VFGGVQACGPLVEVRGVSAGRVKPGRHGSPDALALTDQVFVILALLVVPMLFLKECEDRSPHRTAREFLIDIWSVSEHTHNVKWSFFHKGAPKGAMNR
jgi:hypothetical protein